MILSSTEAREIIDRLLSLSTADEMRVNLSGGRSGNTRFALNSISTSGDEDTLNIRVTAYFGKRHGTASANETDTAALEKLVRAAEELAKLSPEDREYVPELEPQEYLDINPYASATARATPATRVKAALSAIKPSTRKKLESAGFFQHNNRFSAVGNNKGLFGYYPSTNASYSVTVRSASEGGSGWASDNARDINKVKYRQVSNRAVDKALKSRGAKTLEPGVYPVILEPQAVSDLIAFAGRAMSARSADEGRSFYSKTGGGNKIGEQVVGNNITIMSDPAHAQLLGAPFGGDGLPARKMVWIKDGVLQNLFYTRHWAREKGVEPTGFPSNIIIPGGKGSLNQLIRGTDRAVLITRLWYIRYVDPQTILVTGLTRDGTFWVEGGKIRHAVKNFRFNESPIALLNKVTGMSKPTRVGSSLLPAIRASAFTFSSLSEAV